MKWIKLHMGGDLVYINAAAPQFIRPYAKGVDDEQRGGSLLILDGGVDDYWVVDETPEQILALLGETKVDAKIRQAAEVDMVAELLDEISSAYDTREYHLMPKLLLQIENTLGIK